MEMMYPDNKYKKIQFETGEIAWIRSEFNDCLVLIFKDLSQGSRLKINLPKYKVIGEP